MADIEDNNCGCVYITGMDGEAMCKSESAGGRNMSMWYVMQVISGKEWQTVLMMERVLSCQILEKCFVPMRRLKKKYHGEWQEITEKLFPGYVFLISGQPQLLYDELKGIPALTKLLGSCEEYFTPLSESDVCFLRKLQDMQEEQKGLENAWNMQEAQNRLQNAWNMQGKKNRKKTVQSDELWGIEDINAKQEPEENRFSEVGLSQVVVGVDRQIRIVSGPLKNLEGQIQKINLHKRIAVVEAEFMGNKSIIHLGIEIVNEGL